VSEARVSREEQLRPDGLAGFVGKPTDALGSHHRRVGIVFDQEDAGMGHPAADELRVQHDEVGDVLGDQAAAVAGGKLQLFLVSTSKPRLARIFPKVRPKFSSR